MDLSNEQKYAFKLFKQGKNVFITGPGGCGKTKLIENFVNHSYNIKNSVQVCALTGCATLLLPKMCSARTIHSWSGIRLCKGENNKIVENALKSKKAKTNWKQVKVLIVDEVSMMSLKMLEVLNEIGKRIRKNNLPFGGIQVIFSGDFYQLPPVATVGDRETDMFCFQSKIWSELFPMENIVELKKIFRQTDPVYKEILLQIREARLTKENYKILKTYVNREFDSSKYNGCVPTKLYPTRYKTDNLNNTMFSKLPGEIITIKSIEKTNCKTYLESGQILSMEHMAKCNNTSQTVLEYELNSLRNNASYSDELLLKKGSVVMCTVNLDIDNGICNGSQGIIIDFVNNVEGTFPLVRFVNGKTRTITYHFIQSDEYPSVAIGQIPLCLAWALTIHKIQGATLDMADIDVGKDVFECGQTYVALSRVTSLDGLYLSAFNASRIRVNEIVEDFYKSISERDYIIEESDESDVEEFEYEEECELKEETYDPTIKIIKL